MHILPPLFPSLSFPNTPPFQSLPHTQPPSLPHPPPPYPFTLLPSLPFPLSLPFLPFPLPFPPSPLPPADFSQQALYRTLVCKKLPLQMQTYQSDNMRQVSRQKFFNKTQEGTSCFEKMQSSFVFLLAGTYASE